MFVLAFSSRPLEYLGLDVCLSVSFSFSMYVCRSVGLDICICLSHCLSLSRRRPRERTPLHTQTHQRYHRAIVTCPQCDGFSLHTLWLLTRQWITRCQRLGHDISATSIAATTRNRSYWTGTECELKTKYSMVTIVRCMNVPDSLDCSYV